MYKKIITQEELQNPKLEGVRKLASIVKRTLGPGGLPIIIERQGQALDGTLLGPKITKDGVSVAQECTVEDREQDVIMQAVKAICKKTNTDAGDGTTTAIVLGEAILEETQKVLSEDPKLNPQQVKLQVEASARRVISYLKEIAAPVETMEKIEEVATISANGDRKVGEMLRKAFEAVGAEGVVTVDEGSGDDLSLEVVDGYQFQKGAQLRNAFFNNKEQTQYEAENARIIIYDGKVISFRDLIPVLELAMVEKNAQGTGVKLHPTVIIANEFSQEALNFLFVQKQQGGAPVCAVQGPNTTHVRTGYYDDLAAYTGGTRLGNGGRNLQSIQADDIGLADKIIVSKYKTTVYGGQGAEEAILEQVNLLRANKEQAESPYDAQILNDRIACLTNGIAKIGVGGVTELEIKERYDRIEDALNASRAALEEGIVPGGGITLVRAAEEVLRQDTLGDKILYQALARPFYQILTNIGLSESEQAEALTSLIGGVNSTYDAMNLQVVNAFEAGIIDPVKVTRTALENAVSIASLLSTAGGAIILQPPKR